jgi:hypothetical protein
VTSRELLASARRLQELTRQLDQSNRPSDWHQITEGVQIEVRILVAGLTAAVEAVEELGTAATANVTGKARSDARPTSQRAARQVSVRSGTQRGRVLVHLWQYGRCTDPELQERLGLPASSQRPRRIELVELGLVAPNGTTVRDGQEYTLWAVTHEGYAVARRISQGGVATVATSKPVEPSEVDVSEGDPKLF